MKRNLDKLIWWFHGSNPEGFEYGVDSSVSPSQSRSAYIRAKIPQAKGTATLGHTISAEDFAGKRAKLAAHVKADGCTGGASIFINATLDPPMFGDVVAYYDGPEHQGVTGTTDWTSMTCELFIPPETKWLNIGFIMGGSGMVWADGFEIETAE